MSYNKGLDYLSKNPSFKVKNPLNKTNKSKLKSDHARTLKSSGLNEPRSPI